MMSIMRSAARVGAFGGETVDFFGGEGEGVAAKELSSARSLKVTRGENALALLTCQRGEGRAGVVATTGFCELSADGPALGAGTRLATGGAARIASDPTEADLHNPPSCSSTFLRFPSTTVDPSEPSAISYTMLSL